MKQKQAYVEKWHMFGEATSVLIQIDDSKFLTWEGEKEKAVINPETGLMITHSFRRIRLLRLESQLFESVFWIAFCRRFGGIRIWQDFAKLEYSATMFALRVAFLAVSRKPKSFVWTTFWACFQRICEGFYFFEAQGSFSQVHNACMIDLCVMYYYFRWRTQHIFCCDIFHTWNTPFVLRNHQCKWRQCITRNWLE
jgi:hypothetical protein